MSYVPRPVWELVRPRVCEAGLCSIALGQSIKRGHMRLHDPPSWQLSVCRLRSLAARRTSPVSANLSGRFMHKRRPEGYQPLHSAKDLG